MLTTALLVIIGIKLDILSGWYLALIITKGIVEFIGLIIQCDKLGSEL